MRIFSLISAVTIGISFVASALPLSTNSGDLARRNDGTIGDAPILADRAHKPGRPILVIKKTDVAYH